MAWHEWPLVVFTVFAQTAFGAYLLINLSLLNKQNEQQTKGIKLQFFVWVIMGLGLLASTAHLGSPLRAINALNQVGSSWLSNEILGSILFFAAGGLLWLLTMLDKASKGVHKALMFAGILLGVFFMYAMVNVYLIDTVPTWNTIYTPLAFIGTIIVSGTIFGHTLLSFAKLDSPELNRFSQAIVGLGVAFTILCLVSQLVSLSSVQTSIASAYSLVPELSSLMVMRITLLLFGTGLWLTGAKQRPVLQLLGFSIVLISELVSRGVFFGLHMTAGM